MKCDGYHILISEMLQGRLDINEATVVAAHMDVCDSCRSFHRKMVAENPRDGEKNVFEIGDIPGKFPRPCRGELVLAISVILVLLFLIAGYFLTAKHQSTAGRCGSATSFGRGHRCF